ncbi:vha-17 [Pristionchus pacificus]|uniref:V-type proton ATPase subunit n=1 Tax=Pristionchus pacificus TaxID=54126 RepID=A0A2A6BQX9_PRIPA|nr:vha-17 [Pristionchus pacificus]|eukprot:PDM68319.1 vha-17 [Pristionchus pacificus]
MGIVIPMAVVTGFWALVGILGPFVVRRGPNQGIIRTMIVMTAVCCWAFWILVYLHQLNPLIGPQIPVKTIRWLGEKWGNTNN